MRGLIFKGATVKCPFLEALTVVLVCGVNHSHEKSTVSTSHALSDYGNENEDLSDWLASENAEQSTEGLTAEEIEAVIDAHFPNASSDPLTTPQVPAGGSNVTDVTPSSPPCYSITNATLLGDKERWMNTEQFNGENLVLENTPLALQDRYAFGEPAAAELKEAARVGGTNESATYDDMLSMALEWGMEQDIVQGERKNLKTRDALVVPDKVRSSGTLHVPGKGTLLQVTPRLDEISQGALPRNAEALLHRSSSSFYLAPKTLSLNHAYPVDVRLRENSNIRNDSTSFVNDPLSWCPVSEIDRRLSGSDGRREQTLIPFGVSADEEPPCKIPLLMGPADPALSCSHHDRGAATGGAGSESMKSSARRTSIINDPSSRAKNSVWIDDASRTDYYVNATSKSVADPTTSTSTLMDLRIKSLASALSSNMTSPNQPAIWTFSSEVDPGGSTLEMENDGIILQQRDARAKSLIPNLKQSAVSVTHHDHSMRERVGCCARKQHNPETSNIRTPVLSTTEPREAVEHSPSILNCLPISSTDNKLLKGGKHFGHTPLLLSRKDYHFTCTDAVYQLGNIRSTTFRSGIVSRPNPATKDYARNYDALRADCFLNATSDDVTDPTTSTSSLADVRIESAAFHMTGGLKLTDHPAMRTHTGSADGGVSTTQEQHGAITSQPNPAGTAVVVSDHDNGTDTSIRCRTRQPYSLENSNGMTPSVGTTELHSVAKTSPLIPKCIPTTSTDTNKSIVSGNAQSTRHSLIESLGEKGQLYNSFVRADRILGYGEYPEHIPVLPKGWNKHLARHNTVYLEPWWIFTQLIHPDMELNRSPELQTAFELYGYDDINIEDVFGRALDLARLVIERSRMTKRSQLSDRVLQQQPPCRTLNHHAVAVEIVSDAFFRGRSLRPDLKTYLSEKVMLQGNEAFVLQSPGSRMVRSKGHYRLLKRDWLDFRRCTSPHTESTYPFSFDRFCHDVTYLIKNINKPRSLTMLRSKYQRVFEVDILAEVTSVMNAAPAAQGTKWLELAIREGYIPPSRAPAPGSGKGVLAVQCLAGGFANLYRNLFANLRDRDNDSSSRLFETITGPVRSFLTMPIKSEAASRKSLSEASQLLTMVETVLTLADESTSRITMEANFELAQKDLRDLEAFFVAPFGSVEWMLSQLLLPHCPRMSRPWIRPGELQCAFDALGLLNVDVNAVIERALTLATKLSALEGCSLIEPLQPYWLAAKIIHAAFFQDIFEHHKRPQWIQQRVRYEVLPEHKRCAQKVSVLWQKMHRYSGLRFAKGHSEVHSDWKRWLKTLDCVPQAEPDHPLSFTQFIYDLQTVGASALHWRTPVISKYNTLFDRNIIEDFAAIRRSAPDPAEGNSFIEGIKDGFVPFSLAAALALKPQKDCSINRNVLHFVGALVTYYRSLFGAERALKGADAVQPNDEWGELDAQLEQQAEEADDRILHQLLKKAPAQQRLVAPTTNVDLAHLHPVAHFLIRGSLPVEDGEATDHHHSG
eukprot:Blabericola_migrator_1__10313@NODE_579_length_7498_cov_41_155295_g429_i0_p1_GENE_NODE_579_length_7498_cov_41_155295_g429_i0NODE_579_length_7498_cov_41_155295_g429_i0_p1_ORF_typecomplete_len1492_score198_41_NODE_579_length_7498_cov_41_155295_g429_i029567431